MNLLAWNYRGLCQPRSVQELVRLVRTFGPKMVFISEARQIESLRCWLGLRNCLVQGKGVD